MSLVLFQGQGKSSSPYKMVNKKNLSYSGYISMSKLQPHKAYKMVDLLKTMHDRFGPGELATLVRGNARWKVQLPTKYLKELTAKGPEAVEILRDDVFKNQNPYIVFRGEMEDGSFKMDLYPKCKQGFYIN